MKPIIAMLVVSVSCIALNSGVVAQPKKSAREVYEDVKRLEGVFPIPTPSITLDIGAFNGATGSFTGKKTNVQHESTADMFPARNGRTPPTPPPRYAGDYKTSTIINGNRVEIRTIYAPKVNAVDVLFKFKLNNGQSGGFAVYINGARYDYPANTSEATVNVGKVSAVNWKITSGNRSYSDYVELRREPIIGVGAFTIPALPFAIIYEPPSDSENLNKAVYEHSHAVGSKTRTTLTYETSNTKDMRELKWEALSDMRKILSVASDGASYGGEKLAYTKKILDAMKKFYDGLGDVVTHQSRGDIDTSERELVFKQMVKRSISTGANDGGPGVGDIIYYLKNPMVMWIANSTGVHLSILDEVPVVKSVSVGFLKANRNNPQALRNAGVDPSVVDNLLALDPFAADPTVKPPSDRYELWGSFEPTGTGAMDRESLEKQWSESDTKSEAKYYMEITDERTGWLSFIGLGVTEAKTSKLRNSFSNLTEETHTEETLAQVEYYCALDETYAFEVYVDRVFGSFAFRSIPVSTASRIFGKASDQDGKPLAKRKVRMELGGKRFFTNTDKQGEYKFRSPAISSGKAKIYLENELVKTLTLQPKKPVKDLLLRSQKTTRPIKSESRPVEPTRQVKQKREQNIKTK